MLESREWLQWHEEREWDQEGVYEYLNCTGNALLL